MVNFAVKTDTELHGCFYRLAALPINNDVNARYRRNELDTLGLSLARFVKLELVSNRETKTIHSEHLFQQKNK